MNTREFKKAIYSVAAHAYPDAKQIIVQVYNNEYQQQVEATATIYDNGTHYFFEATSSSATACISLMMEEINLKPATNHCN